MPREVAPDELMVLLDRLEELREDLLELGVSSVADIEERMREIEALIDDVPDERSYGPL